MGLSGGLVGVWFAIMIWCILVTIVNHICTQKSITLVSMAVIITVRLIENGHFEAVDRFAPLVEGLIKDLPPRSLRSLFEPEMLWHYLAFRRAFNTILKDAQPLLAKGTNDGC